MTSYTTSDAEDLSSTFSDTEQDWGEEDDDTRKGVETEGCKYLLEELMAEVVVMLGEKCHCEFDSRHVELNFDTSKLPLLTVQALGLTDILTFVLELDFGSSSFGAGPAPRCNVCYTQHDLSPKKDIPEPQPEDSLKLRTAAFTIDPPFMIDPLAQYPEAVISPEETDDVGWPPAEAADSLDSLASHDDPTEASTFKHPEIATVAYQFTNIAGKKLADEWPATRHFAWQQAKEWLPHLHMYLSTRLATLGDYCIICDDKQPLSGLRPVACSKPLCSYQFDEVGYGASMDIIYHSPQVAAAANNSPQHRQRFFACPNPPSDFVDDRAQMPISLAIDPNHNMGIRWAELQGKVDSTA